MNHYVPREKEFYAGLAPELPLLDRVISGETTFEGTLDGILDALEKGKSGEVVKKHKGLLLDYESDESILIEFAEYLDTIDAIAGIEDEELARYTANFTAYWQIEAGDEMKKTVRNFNYCRLGLATTGAAFVLLLIPGGALIDLGLYMLGVGACVKGGGRWISWAEGAIEANKTMKEILEPVYDKARDIDNLVAQHYCASWLNEDQDAFEESYLRLDELGRAHVQDELHSMLEAGALDMDTLELTRYLEGIGIVEEEY